MSAQDREQQNEGEGNRTAARAYDADQRAFVRSGKVDEAARDAAEARRGAEKAELDRAEAAGKAHSHGEDPALKGK
jgi:hypothetical protein